MASHHGDLFFLKSTLVVSSCKRIANSVLAGSDLFVVALAITSWMQLSSNGSVKKTDSTNLCFTDTNKHIWQKWRCCLELILVITFTTCTTRIATFRVFELRVQKEAIQLGRWWIMKRWAEIASNLTLLYLFIAQIQSTSSGAVKSTWSPAGVSGQKWHIAKAVTASSITFARAELAISTCIRASVHAQVPYWAIWLVTTFAAVLIRTILRTMTTTMNMRAVIIEADEKFKTWLMWWKQHLIRENIVPVRAEKSFATDGVIELQPNVTLKTELLLRQMPRWQWQQQKVQNSLQPPQRVAQVKPRQLPLLRRHKSKSPCSLSKHQQLFKL